MGKKLYQLPVCEHYVNTVKQLQKIVDLQTKSHRDFDVIIDFEDGLGTEDKIKCAQQLMLACEKSPQHLRFGVRLPQVNHPQMSALLELLQKLLHRIAYITLAKVQHVTDIDLFIGHITQTHPFKLNSELKIHVLIEDYYGLNNADEIAAHPNVECLIFGIIDFVQNANGAIPYTAVFSPDQFEHLLIQDAKVRLAKAAITHGKIAAHNASMEIDNLDTIYKEAKTAAHRYGFSRMLSIHPNQIDQIISAFSLAEGELQQVVNLLDKARNNKWRPIVYEGRFYDLPSYKHLVKKLQMTPYFNSKELMEDQSFLENEF
ncbi:MULTISPECIES: aldolase/citrate lyase family protein [Cysteiniphilum]|uniref:HpcH/HpaI aldolase/citrate lyase domain-containing protein n=1 Tax=Cysteiniphilum litorale TaxID=2056700 RepID=A0A8J2Z6C8_9GAMM|nr:MULTISPECIES: aldolase/citrate lyase family protein [Cysteiniphilum]GGG05604.1 hypothetical protein GCM10010995_23900 [Cysteiniphilum litorale]